MRFTRSLVVTTVTLSLAGSGLLLNEAWSDPSPATVKSPASVDLSSIAVKAADRAALVMLCRDGVIDPASAGLADNCTFTDVRP